MRVALLVLTRGAVSGGYAKYLREVVPRLQAHHAVEELRVYVPPALSGLDSRYRTWPEPGLFAARRWLQYEVGEWQPDVVFVPSSVHIGFGSIPVVTMMRNMEPLDHPFGGNRWKERLSNVVRAVLARSACRHSARVIAVSGHVRTALEERWRVNPDKIGVVPHGVEPERAETRPAILEEGSRFVFAAGSIRPARGLEDLCAARNAVPADYRVVIAGGIEDEAYAARLKACVKGDVRFVWTGRLAPREMAWCFRNASVFVMTSRAEACPNTVLEAIAHGALSVSTDQPPMPEFYGDAAVYYRRADGGDLARVLDDTFGLDASSVEAIRKRALERSRAFTWDRTVEATIRELDAAQRSTGRPPATR